MSWTRPSRSPVPNKLLEYLGITRNPSEIQIVIFSTTMGSPTTAKAPMIQRQRAFRREDQHHWRCGFRTRKVDDFSYITGLHEATRHAMFGLIQHEVGGRARSRYSNQAAQELAEGMRSATTEKADGVSPWIFSSANRSFGFAEHAEMKKKMAQATRSRCTFPDCGAPRRPRLGFKGSICTHCHHYARVHNGEIRPWEICQPPGPPEEIICRNCYEPLPRKAGIRGYCFPCHTVE